MRLKTNYYELLELYPAATQPEIEDAYRTMLFKHHPDHNPNNEEEAHEKMAAVNEAYGVLSHPLRRKVYNFTLYAQFRENPKEIKFNLFQGSEKKKYDEACKFFKEGVDAFEMNNKALALSKFQQVNETYRMTDALYNIGFIYVTANKMNEAMSAFGECARLEPENTHFMRTVDKLKELTRELSSKTH